MGRDGPSKDKGRCSPGVMKAGRFKRRQDKDLAEAAAPHSEWGVQAADTLAGSVGMHMFPVLEVLGTMSEVQVFQSSSLYTLLGD